MYTDAERLRMMMEREAKRKAATLELRPVSVSPNYSLHSVEVRLQNKKTGDIESVTMSLSLHSDEGKTMVLSGEMLEAGLQMYLEEMA
jgi:hypothetical protein